MKKRQKYRNIPFVFKVFDQGGLLRFPPVEEGDFVECYSCGKNHRLIGAVCTKSRSKDSLFLVYRCKNSWRIGAIFGRLIADRRPDNARASDDV